MHVKGKGAGVSKWYTHRYLMVQVSWIRLCITLEDSTSDTARYGDCAPPLVKWKNWDLTDNMKYYLLPTVYVRKEETIKNYWFSINIFHSIKVTECNWLLTFCSHNNFFRWFFLGLPNNILEALYSELLWEESDYYFEMIIVDLHHCSCFIAATWSNLLLDSKHCG